MITRAITYLDRQDSQNEGRQEIRFDFSHRSDAWAFMRACDVAGLFVRFPNAETASYSVKVGIDNDADRQKACKIASRWSGV